MILRNGIGEPIPILVDQRFSGGFPLSEMTVDDFRRSFDGRSSANRGMQRSSDETEGAISNGAIAEAATTATTLTADDILLLADEPVGIAQGSALGRTSCSGARTGRSGFG